jgi:hypothetical protein
MNDSKNPENKTTYLFNILKPYMLKLVQDAPSYGEITIKAVLHDNDIQRVSLGAEVSRKITNDVTGGIK